MPLLPSLLALSLFGPLTFSAAHAEPQYLGGNETITSFSTAKRLLKEEIYTENRDRVTLYCGATFDSDLKATPQPGYTTTKYKNRALKVEFEHAVASENFGRHYVEYREGHPSCVRKSGERYKGRSCAAKANEQFARQEADLHNLFPALGAPNAMRSNYRFTTLPTAAPSFGSCELKIDSKTRTAEPPAEAKGLVARAHLYMDHTYPQYKMSSSQFKLMSAWNAMYPVTDAECRRNERIGRIQGNTNPFIDAQCSRLAKSSR